MKNNFVFFCFLIYPFLIDSAEANFFENLFKSPEKFYQQGYDDGTVRGYNETCHPDVSNLIYGYFDNPDYAKGFNDGYIDGKKDCLRSQK